jgi:antitoxin (DNA-binding transcriptional repressor) of toxin-antitoxin stability system
MDTITVNLEEAASDLPRIVRALCADGKRVVLTDGGKRLAEIVSLEEDEASARWVGAREVIDEATGHSYVQARPGVRPVTCEDVRRWLGELP